MLSRIQKSMAGKDEGFTLIELLVVIIIIGILAAIAIPVFLNQREKANEASVKSDLKSTADAMETYYADNDAYPTTSTMDAAGGTLTLGSGSTAVDVKLSKNNVVAVMSATGGLTGIATGTYCLAGVSGADSTTITIDNAFFYDSDMGGLQNGKGASAVCSDPPNATPTN